MRPAISLRRNIEQLETFYGAPEPPEITDPWGMIVWENVAYLVDDNRRQQAIAFPEPDRDHACRNPGCPERKAEQDRSPRHRP